MRLVSPLPTGPPVLFLLLAHPLDGATYVANSGGASVCVCVCAHTCVFYVCHVYAMQTHTLIISDNHRASNPSYVLYNEDKGTNEWMDGVFCV